MTISRDQIVSKLLEDKPLSIVRFGDGESIILNALSNVSALERASTAVFKRQTGYSPTLDEMKAVRQNLIDAYTACDIIGVPMHKHHVSSDWAKAAGILKENVPTHTGNICDIDVAYQMLEYGSFDRLLRNRHVLNYISCRDLDDGFKRKWNVGIVNKYAIAPEAKWTSGYEGDVHFPTQFNKVPRWMDVVSQNFPGSLLLVGAGVIGKIYCNWWRDRGGVAFDVGGCMDLWAGRVTRGPEKGLDKGDLTYKL